MGKSFPQLDLPVSAGEAGGTAPAVFNAANETAVAAFLASEIMFTGIVEHIEHVLQAHLGRE